MVSQPQASRGRTVYSSGSFAPTRGPVSGKGVQGYIQRGMKQQGPWGGASKFGRDGKSDTRSGVAQRAMQRQGGWGSNDWKKHYPGGAGPGGGGNGSQPGNGAQPGAGAQPGSGVQTGEAGNAAPANVPSVATPTVVVGDAGKLELPYDPSYGQDVYDALKGSNDEILAIGQQEQAQAAMYAQQQHTQGQAYAGQQVKTLNRGGASGNIFSSGQGMAVASDATSNQNALNSFANENNQIMTDLNTQRTGVQNKFREFLSTRALEYGDELSEDAGELGYGESEPEFPEDTGTRLPTRPGGKKGGRGGSVRPPQNWSGMGGKKPTPKKPSPPKTGHTPPREPGESPPRVPSKPGKKNK